MNDQLRNGMGAVKAKLLSAPTSLQMPLSSIYVSVPTIYKYIVHHKAFTSSKLLVHGSKSIAFVFVLFTKRIC